MYKTGPTLLAMPLFGISVCSGVFHHSDCSYSGIEAVTVLSSLSDFGIIFKITRN